MPSRIFQMLSSRRPVAKGGRGVKSTPTKVFRIPEDILEDLDILISSYEEMIAANQKSPRYDFLKRFLLDLESLLDSED